MRLFRRQLLAGIALTMAATAFGPAVHAGEFDGYTLRVKLIGGAQYEPLYARIPEWEAATGAKVEILSRKNHFELDREIKQDIASGTVNWCVGSNHTSFAPQYGSLYIDLSQVIDPKVLAEFLPNALSASTVDGRLVQLPRHSDVSNIFYRKSIYADPDNQAKFKEKYGYDLAPPETWAEAKDQAIFFSNPPDFYGTQYPGKDEAITGRFYEMLVAEGGAMFDENWNPIFNSEAGVRALNWFVDLYNAKAVPAGVANYLWDDLGLGFASGTVAFDLDWAGWAAFYNDPANSKVANDVGVIRAPKGSSGKRTGWAGSHTFSVTEACDNKAAAVSFIEFMTNEDSQMIEARTGLLPTRAAVWDKVKAEFADKGNTFMAEVIDVWGKSLAEDAFPVSLIPEWIEVSGALWPNLQAAIVGEKTAQQALDDAQVLAVEILKDSGRI